MPLTRASSPSAASMETYVDGQIVDYNIPDTLELQIDEAGAASSPGTEIDVPRFSFTIQTDADGEWVGRNPPGFDVYLERQGMSDAVSDFDNYVDWPWDPGGWNPIEHGEYTLYSESQDNMGVGTYADGSRSGFLQPGPAYIAVKKDGTELLFRQPIELTGGIPSLEEGVSVVDIAINDAGGTLEVTPTVENAFNHGISVDITVTATNQDTGTVDYQATMTDEVPGTLNLGDSPNESDNTTFEVPIDTLSGFNNEICAEITRRRTS